MFWYEIKRQWKTIIIIAVSLALLHIAGMTKFETMVGTSGTNSIVVAMPKVMQVVFGFYGLDIATLVGYFGTMYLYFQLTLCIHAGFFGAMLVVKEYVQKTVDFTYTLPRRNTAILIDKIGAGIVVLCLINVLTTVGLIVATLPYAKGESLTFIIPEMIALFLMQVLYFSIGVVLGVYLKNRMATSIAIGVVLLSYFSSAILQLQDWTTLYVLTPFTKYSAYLIGKDGVESVYGVGIIIVTIALLVLAYSKFKRSERG